MKIQIGELIFASKAEAIEHFRQSQLLLTPR
jgi:hypothetical protein